MIDFITGWILGRTMNKKKEECHYYTFPIEKETYGYIPMPELDDVPTTIEQAYKDYKRNEVVTIHKGNELKHYLETEITPDAKYYGDNETEFYI